MRKISGIRRFAVKFFPHAVFTKDHICKRALGMFFIYNILILYKMYL